MVERRIGSFSISSVKAGMSLIKEIGSIQNTVITIMRNICIMPYRFIKGFHSRRDLNFGYRA